MMHQSGRPQWRTIAVATPSPGGGLPVFARWRRIFLTSTSAGHSGSVIMAKTLMGVVPERGPGPPGHSGHRPSGHRAVRRCDAQPSYTLAIGRGA